MDEPLCERAVHVGETEPTNYAHRAIVCDAHTSGGGIPLVAVDEHLAGRALDERIACEQLARQGGLLLKNPATLGQVLSSGEADQLRHDVPVCPSPLLACR